MEKKKKIFISFSFLDDEFAIALSEYLKNAIGESYFELYCVAINNNYNSVKYGSDFSEDFINNVKSCDVFIPLMSLNYKRSASALIELGAAIALDKEITPLILPGCNYEDFNNIYNLRNREYYGIDNPNKIRKFIELIINSVSPAIHKELSIEKFIENIEIIKQTYIAEIAEVSKFSFKLCESQNPTDYSKILDSLNKEKMLESSVVVIKSDIVDSCNIYLRKPKKLPDFKKYIESRKITKYKIELID